MTIIVILGALCLPARAQGPSTAPTAPGAPMSANGRAESLEYRVADADVVVLGSMQRPAPESSFVNVSVLEAFKGSAPSLVTALYTMEQGAPALTPTPEGVHDLIFLKKISIAPDQTEAADEYLVRSYLRLDEASGVYVSDLALLTSTDEIIGATRRAIAFGGPEEKKSAVLLFPPQAAGSRAAAPSYLVVPVDARLEELGQRWAVARDVHARLRAATALSHFKTPENMNLLRGLLTDETAPYSLGSGKWERGVYVVREQAYKVLTGWGVDVEMPPLEGPMYKYGPAYLDWVLFVPLLVAAWVLMGAVVQGPQFRLWRSLVQATTVVSVLLAAALVVLWVRSWFIVDEVMFPAGTTHHQVASYRGGVHYLVMMDAEMPRGAVYGSFDLAHVEDQWGLGQQRPRARWERMGFGLAVGRIMGPRDSTHPYRVLRVPYYALMAAAMMLPALGTWRAWRGWRRASRGLCRECGYDMRASRGWCPECGARESVVA